MSLSNQVLSSSFFIFLATWVKRLIGIVSMVVLARFLIPEDYGVVAIAMLVLRFFEIFSETGTQQYILSRETLTEQQLHTAWTIKLLSRLILALFVACSSPFVAMFFNDENLTTVVLVIAIVPIINGLNSPGLYLVSRAFQYSKIAAITVITKLLGFAVTVAIAVLYQSYWALVFGDIVLAFTFMVGTYLISSKRPTLMLTGWREQWLFSKWILFKSIVGYSRAKFDIAIVGRLFDTAQVGLYSMAKELAILPHNIITQPLIGVMLTSIGQVKADSERVVDIAKKYLITVFSIMMPIVVGFATLSEITIHVILGENWGSIAPLISIMVIMALSYSMTTVISTTLTAIDKVKNDFFLSLFTFLMVVVVLLWLGDSSLLEFAYYRTILGVAIFIIFFIYLCMTLKFISFVFILALLPAIIAAATMFISLQQVTQYLPISNYLGQFLALVSTGAFVYTITFVCLSLLFKSRCEEHRFLLSKAVLIINKLHSKFSRT